jgi:hypothetical protein
MTMEIHMATFAIDGVRFNPADERVTHVRWGPVDAKKNEWTSPAEIVDVRKVIDAVHAGNTVWTVFTVGGRMILGPQIKVLTFANGQGGIDTEIPDGHIEKSLDDLPRV